MSKPHSIDANEIADISVNMGINALEGKGIEPGTEQAVPFNVAAIRSDLAFTAAILANIAEDGRQVARYAKICALLLVLIFLAIMVRP